MASPPYSLSVSAYSYFALEKWQEGDLSPLKRFFVSSAVECGYIALAIFGFIEAISRIAMALITSIGMLYGSPTFNTFVEEVFITGSLTSFVTAALSFKKACQFPCSPSHKV